MQFVHAGVRSGEAEHIIDGFVHHSDLTGIHVSWAGRDLQSGITEYLVAIGTEQGLSFTSSPKIRYHCVYIINMALHYLISQ